MTIRTATGADRAAIWKILEPVIQRGETYTLPANVSEHEGLAFWFSPGHEVFVWEGGGRVLGTYFLRVNQKGGGAHVANCGYVTADAAQGQGIARAMCRHSMERAKARGFLAMQFNFVVSTNVRAIKLWQSLGFETVGRLPKAFRHPEEGLVDALVMYRSL